MLANRFIMIKAGNLKCGNCKRQLWIDVYEIDTETNMPTRDGFHVACDEDYPFADTCDRTYQEKVEESEGVYNWIKSNNVTADL